ncbi:MAG: NOB1 family endonuclease [Sulfolobales archaeon]
MSSDLCSGYVYILDAAALFASYQLMLPHTARAVTTPEVLEEVRDELSRVSVELSLSAGKLTVVEADSILIDEAVRIAGELGEVGRLSKADLSLVALMVKYSRGGCEVIVVTDDYSLQNIAAYLNLYVVGVKRKAIERIVKYVMICEACGFKGSSGDLCPVCGGRMVRKPLRVRIADTTSS